MTWFKVDDMLSNHPKARCAGLPALGLWTVSGAYASQYLTDGHVPTWFVATWPEGLVLAERLVHAGLWKATPEGWLFHDWEQCNPSKEKVLADRAATAARQQAWRDRKAAEGVTNGPRNASRNGVTNTSSNGPTNTAPTRPDPTRPVLPTEEREDDSLRSSSVARKRAQAPRGTRLPEDWEPPPADIDRMRTDCPGVDLRAEHEKFTDHWRAAPGQKGVKQDWPATWRNWMREAQRRGHRPQVTPINFRQQGVDDLFAAALQRAQDHDEHRKALP